ncbi:MAG: hypothetical protein JSW41_03360, partial [Candidatus Aenigmatarchaeota archaeon]
ELKLTAEPNLPVDTNNPVPPVWLVPEYDIPFQHNWTGILIERSSSTKSRLTNIYVYGSYNGLLVDQQLEYPIKNCYIQGCYNGIVSFGEIEVSNNQVTFFGMLSDGISPYEGEGIAFVSESGDGTIVFEGVDYECWNNVVDSGDRGVVAYGVASPNDPPTLRVVNTAVADCNVAFNGFDAWLGFDINYPGLYNNNYINNFPELPVDNPVYEVNDPLVIDPNDYRIFLDPNSAFVNGGWGYPEVMYSGWTTRADGIPDSNKIDIWMHHQTNRLVKGPTANLNLDDVVDELDLAELCSCWMEMVPDPMDICKLGDLNGDGKVDFIDFSIFAGQWLFNEMSIEIVDLETSQVLSPNNISGYIGIRLKDVNPLAISVSTYLDNLLRGTTIFGWNDTDYVSIDTDMFSNGWHTIRMVSCDLYGNIINHEPIKVCFNNLLYKTSGDGYFHPGEDYKLSGFYNGGGSVEATLKSSSGSVIWSDKYSGSFNTVVIPGSTFGTRKFCELTITETGGMAKSSSGVTKKDLTKKFKQSDYPGIVRMAIILPNKDVFRRRRPAIFECADSCNLRGVIWAVLYHHDVNEENLRFLYNKGSLRYIYWCGHANSHVGRDMRQGIAGVERTHTVCWQYQKSGWWDLFNNWHERGVFSYTRQTVAEGAPLPGGYDQTGLDLRTFNMYDSMNKKLVFVDGCNSAVFWDMAGSYGVFNQVDQIYIGWRIEVLVSTGLIELLLNTTEGVRLFWYRMGQGDTVFNALYYTSSQGSAGVKQALWGPNGLVDIGNYEGDDNLFCWGQGLTTKLDP